LIASFVQAIGINQKPMGGWAIGGRQNLIRRLRAGRLDAQASPEDFKARGLLGLDQRLGKPDAAEGSGDGIDRDIIDRGGGLRHRHRLSAERAEEQDHRTTPQDHGKLHVD
jgi:hypothetical protein